MTGAWAGGIGAMTGWGWANGEVAGGGAAWTVEVGV